MNSKSPRICLFAFCLFSYGAFAQSGISAEQAKVQNVIRAVFEGLSDNNLKAIQNVSTSDMLILEHGVVWNMDSIANVLKRPRAADFKRINTLDFFQTEIKGDMAFVSYNNRADVHSNNSDRIVKWLESAVLVKEGNVWKLKMLHSTRTAILKK